MSNHVPGVQSFFRLLHHFVLYTLAASGIGIKNVTLNRGLHSLNGLYVVVSSRYYIEILSIHKNSSMPRVNLHTTPHITFALYTAGLCSVL